MLNRTAESCVRERRERGGEADRAGKRKRSVNSNATQQQCNRTACASCLLSLSFFSTHTEHDENELEETVTHDVIDVLFQLFQRLAFPC